MKMFNMINIGERAGSGVPDIYTVWENEGWKEPEVIEQYNPNRTILILPFEEKSAIKIGDKKSAIKASSKTEMRYKQILSYMKPGREYKIEEIANMLGLKGS